MTRLSEQSETVTPGIGPTDELSLRVSIAMLAKTFFSHPRDGRTILVLERKATVRREADREYVTVRAQPLGGVSRLHSPESLLEVVESFHYDSEKSQEERDFRIQIRPSDWEVVKQFVLSHFLDSATGVFETDPSRELEEEFAKSLNREVDSSSYNLEVIGLVVEDDPTAGCDERSAGNPTVRVYKVYQVEVTDEDLIEAILENSEVTDDVLRQRALQRASEGPGKGRANALLAIPLDAVVDVYRALPASERRKITEIAGHELHGNVYAVL